MVPDTSTQVLSLAGLSVSCFSASIPGWDRQNTCRPPGRNRSVTSRSRITIMALVFEKTAAHLQAQRRRFSHIKGQGFTYIDTSPLEREMRELNRRSDIGAHWSPKDLENVLKVLFHSRSNTNQKV